MPLYVTVSKGPRADRASPILIVSDQRAIGVLLREVAALADREIEEPAGDAPENASPARPPTRLSLVPEVRP